MVVIDGTSLTLDDIAAIAERGAAVQLAPRAVLRVEAARAIVERHAAADAPVYGINTGFGSLADVKIPADALDELQLNLLRSHAAGTGEPLSVPAVRATIALRANVLAKGYSGVRLETLQALIELLNRNVHPVVPSRGSVGASGDLAPLAHLALVLVGEGQALVAAGTEPPRVLPGAEALSAAGLKPVRLRAKEGLALINGTQPSTAVLALALDAGMRLARAIDIAAALTIDALKGSVHPFEARLHVARPHEGQIASAANIRSLLAGSPINRSHEHCGRVQDAYSLRCAAQVHGAARDALGFVRRTVEIEANAATDNPMVFADAGEIVSGGNFHGAPVAVAADLLAIAAAQMATISERRVEHLVDPAASGLPAFLTREGGLHSGLMMAQVTAAALSSEIKTLAHPASVDSIPTSANKEDHVSMSMSAALKANRAVELARTVVAIELLCACQAIDLAAPLTSSAPLMAVHTAVRARVPSLGPDRPPAPDFETIAELVHSGALERPCTVPLK